ncbi:hypothetical protein ACFYOD_35955 [Streptomyces sp. NPDC006703]|uniref:hypothetical protein n=1 Tax=Streptomyces sp. NPDC006703 TaxID=3364759 RepID=UPI0036759DE5
MPGDEFKVRQWVRSANEREVTGVVEPGQPRRDGMMSSAKRYAVDVDSSNLGEIMAEHSGSVFLRPPGGGREWAVVPNRLRPPTEVELRVARIYSTPVVTR